LSQKEREKFDAEKEKLQKMIQD